jgi:hypothetical protein
MLFSIKPPNLFATHKEIRNMLDRDYCGRTFGISYSILQNDRSRLRDRNNGPFRYWSKEIFGNNYYVCSQWCKSNDEIYKIKLSEWIRKIGRMNI